MSHQMEKLHKAELLAKQNEYALLLQRAHAQPQQEPGDATEETVRVLRTELQHKSLQIDMLQRQVDQLEPLADQAVIASNTKKATRQMTQSRRSTHSKRIESQIEPAALFPEPLVEPEVELTDESDEMEETGRAMDPLEQKLLAGVMWDFEWFINR